ncbi:MAG: ComF family protein [Gammaproteobacteria bacterium]|nr:ComF family protein [Gammaproteobacteria bacterium]
MNLSVNDWAKKLQHWLYPPACVLCGNAVKEGDLCSGCAVELPYNAAACTRCALPLTSAAELCGQCLQDPPSYDSAVSLFRYAYPADHLILRLKFQAQLHLARALGELLAEHLKDQMQAMPEIIIPVPLHRSRLRERGFNQALEIARPIARGLSIPVDYKSCERVRKTSAQSLLPAAERRKNIKGAFRVTRPIAARHVAILDDVMTTGHTVQELAATLRKAGVERIDVWVLARAAWDQ